jgi:hypothetical protein
MRLLCNSSQLAESGSDADEVERMCAGDMYVLVDMALYSKKTYVFVGIAVKI